MKSKNICVILVAGGIGSRMLSATPKQFLQVHGKEVARYSFDIFAKMPEVKEIVVVVEPQYHHFFASQEKKVIFAAPGKRRQDSVYNGFQASQSHCELFCIHDSARPAITLACIQKVCEAAAIHGAAVLGVPVKFTVKESNSEKFVQRTLNRSTIWEIQTPQVIEKSLLQAGFEKAIKEKIDVTDDVSLVELINHPVKLVEGEYSNFKLTTPEDLFFAEKILKR